MKEVFGLEPGGYRRENAFWTSASVDDLIARLPQGEQSDLRARKQTIARAYGTVSDTYQSGKSANDIPLA